MTFGIILLLIIGILYLLLVKGYLWKIILTIFGFWGMFIFLSKIPECSTSSIVVGDSNFSWALILPIVVVLLAMACTKAE